MNGRVATKLNRYWRGTPNHPLSRRAFKALWGKLTPDERRAMILLVQQATPKREPRA